MSKTPAQTVKEKFGEKSKLVEAVQKFVSDDGLWLARQNESKGLARVSNAKLLRLIETFGAVKEKFGSREKLVDAIVEVEGRAKDAGYRARFTEWPVPRLFDHYKSASKRAKSASADKAEKSPKVAKPAKAEAKAAPAKKGAEKKPAAKAATKAEAPAKKKAAAKK